MGDAEASQHLQQRFAKAVWFVTNAPSVVTDNGVKLLFYSYYKQVRSSRQSTATDMAKAMVPSRVTGKNIMIKSMGITQRCSKL